MSIVDYERLSTPPPPGEQNSDLFSWKNWEQGRGGWEYKSRSPSTRTPIHEKSPGFTDDEHFADVIAINGLSFRQSE